MKTLNCTYPKKDGWYMATIKLGDKLIHTEECIDIQEAVEYTNAFCEGFRKGEKVAR